MIRTEHLLDLHFELTSYLLQLNAMKSLFGLDLSSLEIPANRQQNKARI